jgi:ectoine hydroxylase-related dioxygenase (phytanoyl-CoA dioxygenase family)
MNKMVAVASDDTQRDTFVAEGYVVFRGVLDTAWLDEINAEMLELFHIQLRRLGLPISDTGDFREDFHADALALLRADVPAYISTARMTQMFPSVHRLMISEPVMQIARRLGIGFPVISTRVSNHIISDLLKIPGGYHKSPPHQDWRSIQGSLDSIVLWAPTTPVTEQSHPLEVVPRSHLFGLCPTVDHIQTPAVEDPRIREEDYVPLAMQPGDIVAFSTFLVHRTGEQGDGRVRVAYSGRFNNAAEPTFVEHGYPTPYKYAYQTDLIVPDFPKPADLRAIFPAAKD